MLKRLAPSTRSAFLVRLCLALSVLAGAVALQLGITQAGFNAGRFRLASGGGHGSKLTLRSVPTRAGGRSAGAARARVVATPAPLSTTHTTARGAARPSAFTRAAGGHPAPTAPQPARAVPAPATPAPASPAPTSPAPTSPAPTTASQTPAPATPPATPPPAPRTPAPVAPPPTTAAPVPA